MNGERVRQARELTGYTQRELADQAGVVQSAIAQIESGFYSPSESVLAAIALKTGFDISFFRQSAPPADFPIGTVLYRTQAKVTSRQKARAHRLAQLMFELAETMRRRLKDIPALIPRTDEPVPIAAQLARDSLGLSPDSPIPNLINALERAGVLVLELPLEVAGLDGFSSWVGPNHERPVICLLSGKHGYRRRFTVAEEFCHLIKHRPLRCTVAQADAEARSFAGELLLPENSIRQDIFVPVTLASLAPLRAKYQVSLQFLLRRVADLEIITPNQYRYLMAQLASKGWRTMEPKDDAIPQEKPKLFSKMLQTVYGNPPDWNRLRQDTAGAPLSLLRSIVGCASCPSPEPNKRGVISFDRRAS